MCTPNLRYWGYFQTQWRQWPVERRPDITFPGDRGKEHLATPPPATPVPLPKEQYAPPPGAGGMEGIPIQEGPSTGPETPFQLESGLPGLPGLPTMPETPPPGTPPPGTPQPGQMPIEGAPDGSPTPESTPKPGEGGSINVSPESPQGQPEQKAKPTQVVDAQPPMSVVQPSQPIQEAQWQVEVAVPEEPVEPMVPETPAEPWAQPRAWKSDHEPAESRAERPVGYEAPVEPSPVGLDGYCPVTLAQTEQWVQGDSRLAVQYEGKTYLMSGPIQHRMFRAPPRAFRAAVVRLRSGPGRRRTESRAGANRRFRVVRRPALHVLQPGHAVPVPTEPKAIRR